MFCVVIWSAEPKGSAQLRLTVEKHQTVVAKAGEDAVLPCLAQGHPVPTYRSARYLMASRSFRDAMSK